MLTQTNYQGMINDWIAHRVAFACIAFVLIAFALAFVAGIAYPPVEGKLNPTAQKIGVICFRTIIVFSVLFTIDFLFLLTEALIEMSRLSGHQS